MSATCAKPSVRSRCCGAVGENVRERVLALDAAVGEVVRAVGAERDRRRARTSGRAASRRAGARAARGCSSRVALVDLLERQPAALLHQVDEAEVARAEHDDVAVGDVVLRPLLLLAPGRLARRRGRPSRSARRRRRSPATSPPRERALDELVEAVAVALLEGRALRLAVVGEDDDLVRPRRVAARALDPAELLVELAQRLERVGALEARSGARPRRSSRRSRRRRGARASCR